MNYNSIGDNITSKHCTIQMDVLSSAIKFFVKGVLDEASKRVAKRFDVSIDDAMDIWKDLHIDLDTIPSITLNEKTIKKPVRKTEKSSDDEDEDKPDGCTHILTRGPNEGGECGKKISAKSQTGIYCSVHLNQENKVKPTKKVKAEKITKDTKDDTVNIKIRLDPDYGRYVQSGTGLVFKSAQEKIVIGVQDDHGDLLKLTKKDVDICKKYRFVYDEKCVEKSNIEIEISDDEISED
ncbi:MAG: hypothetical protein PHG66_01845 [Candidatus Colwellbacteria bacterium]|nr:hypothetical protein [Candidatus Colwellbacteria bacterium]